MASTNKTTNYNLSQFIGSDKPTYLGDYNSDMLKIDTQMKANADNVATAMSGIETATATANSANQTAQTANTTANSASTTASEANTNASNAQSTANSALATATTAQSTANTVNTNVGNLSDLDTTDKTSIVNAINEVATGWTSLGSASGSNPITLPNDYKELMLEIDSPTAGNFAFCLERTMLSNNSKGFKNGGYISLENCCQVQVNVSLTSASIAYVYQNGVNEVTNAATLYAWYK